MGSAERERPGHHFPPGHGAGEEASFGEADRGGDHSQGEEEIGEVEGAAAVAEGEGHDGEHADKPAAPVQR